MKYRLHNNSQKAWKAMIDAIDNAQKSIYIEMYIFSADTGRHYNFLNKLKKKARLGIRVIIVADAFGSEILRNGSAKELRESGIELIFFSHWLRHIHRKILLVDEKIAFLGGVNIGRRFRRWNDLELEIEGRTVKRILQSFAKTYSSAGGKNPQVLKWLQRKMATRLKFWLLEHWPSKNIHTLRDHYTEKINLAQKTIQIATPYFIPPRWLISLLDNAIRRGVAVEVIMPKKSDYPIISRINYRFAYMLHCLGIKFYLTRKMNHSKMLLIDEQEGLIGSQNIDPLSFRFNSEIGIFFQEKRLISQLEETLMIWKKEATPFSPQKYKLHPMDWLILLLVKIFHPIL